MFGSYENESANPAYYAGTQSSLYSLLWDIWNAQSGSFDGFIAQNETALTEAIDEFFTQTVSPFLDSDTTKLFKDYFYDQVVAEGF